MAESFSVKAILSAKDSGFSSTLKSASSTLDSLGSKLKSGFGMGILQGMGQQLFSSLSNGARELVGEINSSNKAWKTFDGNMKILGKSEKDIKSVKKTLQDYAQTTVYSSSDMASSYAQLEAVGIKAADKLVTGFGGLAGAAENPAQAMKTLSQQGVQMAAKPAVAWQDFKLMLEQTPAGMAAVAKEMGMTTSELVTAVQDGKVKTNDFFKAVEKVGNSEGFSKLATEYKSVDQAMDGLKETMGNKLMPAFDALSQGGIGAISGIIDKLDGIDGNKLAAKVTAGLETAGQYWEAFTSSFSGVGTEIMEAFNAVKSGVQIATEALGGSSDPLENFKSIVSSVAEGIKTAANFIEEHGETIGKALPYVVALVGAYKGFKVVSSVVPGVTAFTKGIAGLAGKGIGSIASKLFGISSSQKTVGTTSAISGAQMLTAAKSYALMGVAVLLIAASFALLAYSAISLANAGGLAIGVMAGLVVGVAALGIGMAVLLKSLAPMSGQLMPVAMAFLAMGAAVLLISAGFALMAVASIALANAGGAAIGVMVGMVAAIALLAVGAAALGTSLTAGAVGFLAFGAAVLMVGAGFALIGVAALLAANALTIVATVLPLIAASGLQGALAITALGGALTVFAVGAGLAGAACIILGAGLLLIGTAVLLAGAGMLLLGTGTLLAATALSMITAILPQIATYGMSGAAAIAVLGAGMLAFAVGAAAAGVAAVVFAAGLVAVSVAIVAASVSVVVLAASIVALAAAVAVAAVAMALAAGGLALLNLALPQTIAHGAAASAAMLALAAGLLAMGAGLLVMGAGALVAAAGMVVFGAAMVTGAAGTLLMVAALKGVNSSMKSIAKNAKTTQKSLKSMQSSVNAVESGLSALGDKAKSAMNSLKNAFDDTASKAKSAGKKTGTGFDNGMKSGLTSATNSAKASSVQIIAALTMAAAQATATGASTGTGYAVGIQGGMVIAAAAAASGSVLVVARLRSGYSGAYSAGAYISMGFAAGMRSQLGAIESAAARMATAAEKAIRAKAKIHSPSRVSGKLGYFWAAGYINEIDSMSKDAWKAAANLVAIPKVATPDLSGTYGGEMSEEYEYYKDAEYIFTIPFDIDGREFARATVKYSQEELDRRQTRENRKSGKV